MDIYIYLPTDVGGILIGLLVILVIMSIVKVIIPL